MTYHPIPFSFGHPKQMLFFVDMFVHWSSFHQIILPFVLSIFWTLPFLRPTSRCKLKFLTITFCGGQLMLPFRCRNETAKCVIDYDCFIQNYNDKTCCFCLIYIPVVSFVIDFVSGESAPYWSTKRMHNAIKVIFRRNTSIILSFLL